MIDPQFEDMLNRFLDVIPGSIDSLCRTPYHNQKEGGAPGSGHVYGTPERPLCCAADIIYDSIDILYKAAALADTYGFTGVELDLSNNHLHVDTLVRDVEWKVVHHGPKNEEPLKPWLVARQLTDV